jgi:uncharacterized protein YutE (UPF0331/DUF86 family)
MVDKNIVLAKISRLSSHLDKIKKHHCDLETLLKDSDKQDIILLNLMQAIQVCIDIGTHIAADSNLGIMDSYSEVFERLSEQKILSTDMAKTVINMIGLRNKIAHEYEGVDFKRVHTFIQNNLDDFFRFIKEILKYVK